MKRIALLPGWGIRAACFAGMPAKVAGLQTTRIELPGHGVPEAGSAEDWLDRLRPALACAPVWAGWSLGGLLAIAAAAARPPDRLILIASTPCFEAREDWQGIAASEFDAMTDLAQSSAKAAIARMLALGVRSEARALRQHAAQPPPSTTLLQGLAWLRRDLRVLYRKLDIPILWVHGRQDRLVPAVAQIHRLNPSASHHVFEKAGHAPFLSEMQPTISLMEDFLS